MSGFICLHPGPRGRQYGIPVALAGAGLLARFYTDACITQGTAEWLQRLFPVERRPLGVQRILSRTLPAGLPRHLVRADWRYALPMPLRDVLDLGMAVDVGLHRQVMRDGFGTARGLYTIFNGSLDLARAAKRAGLAVVHDQVLNPDVGRILRAERARYAGVEVQTPSAEVEDGIRRDQAMWELADLVLAPSTFTRDALLKLGASGEKIALVEYGIDAQWLDLLPQPEPGRILFVGTVGLRKGTHILAEACRLLKARNVPCRVVVVGRYDSTAIAKPLFAGPEYLGPVPRSRIAEQYVRADVFVHPSLSEGSAIAHLEALACGLPVVAAESAGPVFEDGVEGFVVQSGDATALAERLAQLVTDRQLRARMSRAARLRAAQLTHSAYQQRLAGALRPLLHASSSTPRP